MHLECVSTSSILKIMQNLQEEFQLPWTEVTREFLIQKFESNFVNIHFLNHKVFLWNPEDEIKRKIKECWNDVFLGATQLKIFSDDELLKFANNVVHLGLLCGPLMNPRVSSEGRK